MQNVVYLKSVDSRPDDYEMFFRVFYVFYKIYRIDGKAYKLGVLENY